MPRHTDEERAIVSIISGPPLLRCGHQRMEILDYGIEVEALELLRIIELLVRGIRQGGVLMQNPQVQLVRPPVSISWASCQRVFASAARKWALCVTWQNMLLLIRGR